MKLLAEISEASLGIGESEQLNTTYELQKCPRAILRNADGKIAVQYLETYAYHKLPGGALEQGEALEQALRREVREEVGCEIDLKGGVGMTIEYRNMHNLLQIAYCFVTDVSGSIGQPQLEQAEIEEGATLVWMHPEIALEKMKNDVPEEPKGHFILKRETTFLEEYLKTVQGNKTEIRI